MGSQGNSGRLGNPVLHQEKLSFAMPIYEFECQECGNRQGVLAQLGDDAPVCCDAVMSRIYSTLAIRDSRSITGKRHELWIGRIDEIHKRQADRGERLRLPHPSEVL